MLGKLDFLQPVQGRAFWQRSTAQAFTCKRCYVIFNIVTIELIPGPGHNIQLITLLRTCMCKFYAIHKTENVNHILLDKSVAVI